MKAERIRAEKTEEFKEVLKSKGIDPDSKDIEQQGRYICKIHLIDGEEQLIAFTHNPARIVEKDFVETYQAYRYRRTLLQAVLKQKRQKGYKYWESEILGTLNKKKLQDEQHQEDSKKLYDELIASGKMEEHLQEIAQIESKEGRNSKIASISKKMKRELEELNEERDEESIEQYKREQEKKYNKEI